MNIGPHLIRSAFAIAAFAVLHTAAVAPLPASAATTVTIGTVGLTSDDWPLYIAQKTGLMAAQGINLDIVDVGSPVGATQQLVTGAIDIGAVTSTQMAQGVQSGATVVSIMQITDKPPYLVIGKKGITSVKALKGKTVIVSGPSAITRVFMDTVLEKNGLKQDDVTFTYAGATNERYAALVSGGVDAAILLPPFSFRAVEAGYPVLDDVKKYYPHFPFDGYAVSTAWGPAHRPVLVAFLKGLLAGVKFLYDPANKTRAIAILMEQTNTPLADAAKTYDELVTKEKEYSLTGTSTPDDYNQVIYTLIQLGLVKPPLPSPTKFYDNSYLNEAEKR